MGSRGGGGEHFRGSLGGLFAGLVLGDSGELGRMPEDQRRTSFKILLCQRATTETVASCFTLSFFASQNPSKHHGHGSWAKHAGLCMYRMQATEAGLFERTTLVQRM
jgi:hypothetical protein